MLSIKKIANKLRNAKKVSKKTAEKVNKHKKTKNYILF